MSKVKNVIPHALAPCPCETRWKLDGNAPVRLRITIGMIRTPISGTSFGHTLFSDATSTV